ncbi:hypothetical protein [Flammeovirga agarivorans]|uniref:Uncharacterized protein n=1 Tax=Flammeovirga agarivorans TaxID=2726742 RepID=A0A7X8SRS0_9BACT|nr:hypothetical protein [Flammeovirga agarivorans]NLR95064.1 hypothetical protein [Flammeovirga agarivorans]
MNRKRLILLTIGLLTILTVIWAYPKIDQFFKVDSCLDKGGRWNYETNECEFEYDKDDTKSQINESLSGHAPIADERKRKTKKNSEYNTDLENIDLLEKTLIINPTVDTTELFKIWTLDPDGPHADFWLKPTEFYVVDYDGDGSMPYLLNKDSLTIFYNDFVQKGKIASVGNDTLKIYWDESERLTLYVEWKN